VTSCSCPGAPTTNRSPPSAHTSTGEPSIHRKGPAAPLSHGSGLRSGMRRAAYPRSAANYRRPDARGPDACERRREDARRVLAMQGGDRLAAPPSSLLGSAASHLPGALSCGEPQEWRD
jgi:hypothetical protein